MRGVLKGIFIFLVFLLLTVPGLAFYLTSTPNGIVILSGYIARNYGVCDLSIEKSGGNIIRGVTLSGVKFRRAIPYLGLCSFSAGNINLRLLSFKGFSVAINNGLLKQELTEPIVFYGSLGSRGIDLNFYTNSFAVRDVLKPFFKSSPFVEGLRGRARKVDIYLKGNINAPRVEGTFDVEWLAYHDFTAQTVPVSLSVQVKNENKIYGEIILHSGKLSGPKTAVVRLKKSRIIYAGDPAAPAYQINADASVEKVKIDIALTGGKEKPRLKLFSDPPRPQNELLIMIMTDKSWNSVYRAMAGDGISSDLASDALDYFVFGGAGHKISKALGINFSFKMKGGTTEVTVKKDIGKKVTAGYAVTQEKNQAGTANTTHAVLGEYKVTDHVSVEAQKDIINSADSNGSVSGENKVLLKYKKSF